MDQLARDAGPGGLPPCVAAEHRNTAHAVAAATIMCAPQPMKPEEYRVKVIEAQIRPMHECGIWVKPGYQERPERDRAAAVKPRPGRR